MDSLCPAGRSRPSNGGADSLEIVMPPVVGSPRLGAEEVLMSVIEQHAAPTFRRGGLARLLRDLVVISRPRFWFLSFVAIH